VQLQALEFVAGKLAKRIHSERGEFEYLGHRFVKGYKMGCLTAGAVLVVLEVVVLLQACQYCMGLRQILSAGHNISHGGSSTYSREESTQSPHQYETSPANLPDKGSI
jgi:hypothetical protein